MTRITHAARENTEAKSLRREVQRLWTLSVHDAGQTKTQREKKERKNDGTRERERGEEEDHPAEEICGEDSAACMGV